jgi:hypothetical protein
LLSLSRLRLAVFPDQCNLASIGGFEGFLVHVPALYSLLEWKVKQRLQLRRRYVLRTHLGMARNQWENEQQ